MLGLRCVPGWCRTCLTEVTKMGSWAHHLRQCGGCHFYSGQYTRISLGQRPYLEAVPDFCRAVMKARQVQEMAKNRTTRRRRWRLELALTRRWHFDIRRSWRVDWDLAEVMLICLRSEVIPLLEEGLEEELFLVRNAFSSISAMHFSNGNNIFKWQNVGDPQGSNLGLHLWSIVYDGLLRVLWVIKNLNATAFAER
jgi:hypothetical protein